MGRKVFCEKKRHFAKDKWILRGFFKNKIRRAGLISCSQAVDKINLFTVFFCFTKFAILGIGGDIYDDFKKYRTTIHRKKS